MATIYNQIIEKTINEETGEITEKREMQAMRFGEEPLYIKLYLKDIMFLSDVPAGLSNVTYALLKRATYAGEEFGMTVILNSFLKKRIMKEVGYERMQSLDNSIRKLVKGKILYRIDMGTFQFNPYLFGKGNWADVAKIRLNVDYSEIEGKTFGAVIKYKNGNEKENEYEEVEAPEY